MPEDEEEDGMAEGRWEAAVESQEEVAAKVKEEEVDSMEVNTGADSLGA